MGGSVSGGRLHAWAPGPLFLPQSHQQSIFKSVSHSDIPAYLRFMRLLGLYWILPKWLRGIHPSQSLSLNHIVRVHFATLFVAVESLSRVRFFVTPGRQRARLPCPLLSPGGCCHVRSHIHRFQGSGPRHLCHGRGIVLWSLMWGLETAWVLFIHSMEMEIWLWIRLRIFEINMIYPAAKETQLSGLCRHSSSLTYNWLTISEERALTMCC